MSEDDSRNERILPFARSLFGVYQPITGWKGNLAKKRVALEQEENVKSIIDSMINDISIREILGQGDPRTVRPDTEVVVRPPDWMDTEVVKYLREQAGAKKNAVAGENAAIADSTNTAHQATGKTTTNIEFEEKVRKYFERNKISEVSKAWQAAGMASTERSGEGDKDTAEKTNEFSETRQDIEKNSISKLIAELESAIIKLKPEDSLKASVTAGVLGWLKETSPDLLHNLCFQNKTHWEIQTNFVDPIADFDLEIYMPILSPIGIVHLFKQHFFNLENVMSDPASNASMNPESAVSVSVGDDFWDSLKDESKNIRYAICDNGIGELPVYLDEATPDTGYQKNVTHAKDIAVLHLRKQIRRAKNKVGVKLQHAGTQMCWQIYVDDPGLRLGIPGLERMDVPEGIQTTINWFPYNEYQNAVQEKMKQSGQVRRRTSSELREEESYILYRYVLRYLMGTETGRKKHVSDEIFRSLFDIEKIFYYIAPDWWLPRLSAGSSGQLNEAGNDELSVKQWLVQLDGDNRRNALLNSPWVKVVIPIREGRETAALKWLQLAHVEGNDGLDAVCQTRESEAQDIPVTFARALDMLVQEIVQQPRMTESLWDAPEAADIETELSSEALITG